LFSYNVFLTISLLFVTNKEIDIEEDDDEQEYFDPTFAEIDRVIQCVEIFPIIHPKKANEIKGKTTELLAVITAKLLSFSKNFPKG